MSALPQTPRSAESENYIDLDSSALAMAHPPILNSDDDFDEDDTGHVREETMQMLHRQIQAALPGAAVFRTPVRRRLVMPEIRARRAPDWTRNFIDDEDLLVAPRYGELVSPITHELAPLLTMRTAVGSAHVYRDLAIAHKALMVLVRQVLDTPEMRQFDRQVLLRRLHISHPFNGVSHHSSVSNALLLNVAGEDTIEAARSSTQAAEQAVKRMFAALRVLKEFRTTDQAQLDDAALGTGALVDKMRAITLPQTREHGLALLEHARRRRPHPVFPDEQGKLHCSLCFEDHKLGVTEMLLISQSCTLHRKCIQAAHEKQCRCKVYVCVETWLQMCVSAWKTYYEPATIDGQTAPPMPQPLRCPTCKTGPICPVGDVTFVVGVGGSELEEYVQRRVQQATDQQDTGTKRRSARTGDGEKRIRK